MGRKKTSLFAQARAKPAEVLGMRLLPLLTIASLLIACEDTAHTHAVEEVSSPLVAAEAPADPYPTDRDEGEDDGEPVDDEGPVDDEVGDTSDDTTDEDEETADTTGDTSDDGQPDEEADALVWASYDCDGHAQALFAIVHLAGKSGAYDEEAAGAYNDIVGKLVFIDYRDTLFTDMPDYCMDVASDEWMDQQCFGLTTDRKWVEFAYEAENSPQHDALYMNWYDSYVPIVDGEHVYPGC